MSDNINPSTGEPADQAPAAISESDRTEAEKEGVKNAVTKSAETNFSTRVPETETNAPGDRWPDRSDIMRFEGLLDLSPEDFEARVAADSKEPVAESKVAGLLGLERSGRNRTNYVKAMMARLGIQSPYEVSPAGPAWTNDISKLTAL